ncbi:MAG: hypothetical protein DYG88_08110 [Chloroflexi bacterium CFX4]|nr:hypothetical protein [Chloroflexi bacterium CFX4]MDL1921288.1 hypothetical protein [Chloroflexi bacterium CFX3]
MRLFALSICGLMIAAMVFAVARHSLNFSPHDDWADSIGVALAIKLKEGRLTPNDLFVPYNGHPLLVWRLVTAAHTALFNYDVRVEQWLTILLVCLNFALMGKLLWHGFGRAAPPLYWIGMVLIACLLFTPRHTYNYLWGVSLIWAGSVTCFLLGLWLIVSVKSALWRFCGLLAAATIAFFTQGVGAVLWLAWLPSAWLRGERSRRFWFFYGVGTALFLAARFLLGEGVQSRASIAVDGFSISRSFTYFGILLGNVIIVYEVILIGLGIAVVAFWMVSIVALLRLGAPLPEVGVLASIGAFAVLAAALISVARHDIVPLLISSSLYLVHTQLIWIACVVASLWLIHLQIQKRVGRLGRYGVLVNTGMLASLIGVTFFFHVPLYQTSFQREFDCMWRYAFSGEIACTAEFVPRFAQNAVPRLEGMIAHRLGAFNQAPQRAFEVPFDASWRIPDLPYRYLLHVTAHLTCPDGSLFQVSAVQPTGQIMTAAATLSESAAYIRLDLSAWRGKPFRLMYHLESAQADGSCQATAQLRAFMHVEALSAP